MFPTVNDSASIAFFKSCVNMADSRTNDSNCRDSSSRAILSRKRSVTTLMLSETASVVTGFENDATVHFAFCYCRQVLRYAFHACRSPSHVALYYKRGSETDQQGQQQIRNAPTMSSGYELCAIASDSNGDIQPWKRRVGRDVGT